MNHETIGDYRLEIIQDEDPCNPRKDYDNFGTMLCWHRRYDLGDKHNYSDPSEVELPEGSVVLPLYLYDHSGITMSTQPFSCKWDSGQVGIIYATPEQIRKEFVPQGGCITDAVLTNVKQCLINEVDTYDQYLRGDVWGYEIFRIAPVCEHCGCKREDELVESCWGFYGKDYCKEEGLAAMKCLVRRWSTSATND